MTVLVDSNIPMYLIGTHHPLKVDAQRLLEELAIQRRRLVTDAEVFQEILHRYRAINRLDAVQPAFDALEAIVEDVWPITQTTVARAKDLLLTRDLSARDAVHLAAMEEHGATEIASFDRDFDAVPGITRLA